MADFFLWLQSFSIATYVRESGLTYPIIMSIHLAGMGLFGGLILMTDLRLLGLVMRSATITEVVTQFRVWKRLGIVVVAGCGVMLAWSKAAVYSANPYFWLKLVLLSLVIMHAFVFRKSVYHNTEDGARAFVDAGLPIFFLSRLPYPGWAIDLLKASPYSYAQKSINTPDEKTWKPIPVPEDFRATIRKYEGSSLVVRP